MSAAINQYIAELSRLYKTGNATEHSYRPAFQRLLECLMPSRLMVTNDPKLQQCGAPDYIITNAGIPVGYIETKEIGKPFYSSKQNGFVCNGRYNVIKHFINFVNVGLIICTLQSTFDYQHIFVSNIIAERCLISSQTKDAGSGKLIENTKRHPNLNVTIIKEIEQRTVLQFSDEPEEAPTVSAVPKTFSTYDILDYIYAILHSQPCRVRYKEFLKIDFPRVPYLQDSAIFCSLVNFGVQLRRLHLIDNVLPITGLADYIIESVHQISEIKYAGNRVFINRSQYFNNVPPVAYEFFSGGYQPAQKWLKDRKGSSLQYDDILHYRKIIRILKETA